MCEPVTLLLALSAGASVAGSVTQASAAEQAAEYNAQIAEQNALLAEQQAQEEERRFRINSRKQLGAMRAAYSAAGVTLEGTPWDVIAESTYTAELDALTIREGGQVTASAYEAEGRLQRLRGRQAERTGYVSAAADLARGGTSYYRTRAT